MFNDKWWAINDEGSNTINYSIYGTTENQLSNKHEKIENTNVETKNNIELWRIKNNFMSYSIYI